ncbi:HI0074 family nucleotidyltransferase substrate-binding subunit [bacterium]|nr:HI0074 family nucleotidyltransferase substrate-binding subunit [bacterium]
MKKFENFKNNLAVLKEAGNQDLQNEFVKGGVINKFFLQFELSWKVLKELLMYEGISEASSGSPREIIKSAFKIYDFIDEDAWLSMLNQRNSSLHIYDKEAANNLVDKIISE